MLVPETQAFQLSLDFALQLLAEVALHLSLDAVPDSRGDSRSDVVSDLGEQHFFHQFFEIPAKLLERIYPQVGQQFISRPAPVSIRENHSLVSGPAEFPPELLPV